MGDTPVMLFLGVEDDDDEDDDDDDDGYCRMLPALSSPPPPSSLPPRWRPSRGTELTTQKYSTSRIVASFSLSRAFDSFVMRLRVSADPAGCCCCC
jgi:hypothetical protein